MSRAGDNHFMSRVLYDNEAAQPRKLCHQSVKFHIGIEVNELAGQAMEDTARG